MTSEDIVRQVFVEPQQMSGRLRRETSDDRRLCWHGSPAHLWGLVWSAELSPRPVAIQANSETPATRRVHP